jgi:hypothetical protein
VVLLDEVEKAHQDVFNVLLQVLDDGRLTDGQGRTVDFRNTVIIMTSNLGSDVIQQLAGEKQYARMKTEVMARVQAHFRPEFINRIDDIVVFHPLGAEQIRVIKSIAFSKLILWAGLFPDDMDFEKGKEVLKEKDVRLVYGRNDPFLTEARVIEMKSLAQKTGVTSIPIIFDGAHEMNEPTLLELIN